jgi:hypothetical protein
VAQKISSHPSHLPSKATKIESRVGHKGKARPRPVSSKESRTLTCTTSTLSGRCKQMMTRNRCTLIILSNIIIEGRAAIRESSLAHLSRRQARLKKRTVACSVGGSDYRSEITFHVVRKRYGGQRGWWSGGGKSQGRGKSLKTLSPGLRRRKSTAVGSRGNLRARRVNGAKSLTISHKKLQAHRLAVRDMDRPRTEVRVSYSCYKPSRTYDREESLKV